MKKINSLLFLIAITFSTIFAKSTLNLSVKGMHCGGCETKFTTTATNIKGITEVKSVSAANSTAVVEFDEKTITAENVVKSLADKTGYTITTTTGEIVNAAGTPAACCMKGEKNASCKKGDKAKCAKTKCDKAKSE